MTVLNIHPSDAEVAERRDRVQAMSAAAIKAITAIDSAHGEPDLTAMLLACMSVLVTNIMAIPPEIAERLTEDADTHYLVGVIAGQMEMLENPRPPQKMDS